MRTEFLGLVGHELRAPLLAIKGSAEAGLEEEAELDPAEIREFFRIIAEQAGHMRGLIRDLLDAGRIDSGTLSVAAEPSEVVALVERARSTFLSGGGRHAVLVDLPADLPPVMADRRRIVQVLNNLLANAARHAPEATPIRVAAVREDAHVAVSVSDGGSGVAPELLPHLFSKHSGDRPGATAGHGLGIAISKGLVEAHGGPHPGREPRRRPRRHLHLHAAGGRGGRRRRGRARRRDADHRLCHLANEVAELGPVGTDRVDRVVVAGDGSLHHEVGVVVDVDRADPVRRSLRYRHERQAPGGPGEVVDENPAPPKEARRPQDGVARAAAAHELLDDGLAGEVRQLGSRPGLVMDVQTSRSTPARAAASMRTADCSTACRWDSHGPLCPTGGLSCRLQKFDTSTRQPLRSVARRSTSCV